MSTIIPYREQVNETLVALSNIGKPVWVLFQHEKNKQFYRGEITEIHMKKVGDDSEDGISTVAIAHFVVVDDGDKGWYNLAEQEDAGQLVWQEPAKKMLLNKRVVRNIMIKPQETKSAAQLPPPVGKGQGKKKRKNDIDETDDDYYEDSDDDEIRDELNNIGNMKRARVVSSDSSDARNNDQQEQATRQFKTLGSTTRKWVNVLGLAMAYGSKHDALDIILDNPSKYVMPEAFEQVFFLADFLFPGKDYHQTLYASYTKPGQPVRDVLLDLKRENPQDPLISWHAKCGKWTPPTASVCVGMIKLIQEMI